MKVNKTKLYLSMVELHKSYRDCDLIFIELFELNYWIPVASTETIVDESRLVAILCTGFQISDDIEISSAVGCRVKSNSNANVLIESKLEKFFKREAEEYGFTTMVFKR